MSESLPPTKRHLTRQLRERKRAFYSDEWALGDDEAVEGGRGFSLADKLESSRFDHPGSIRDMHGVDLTVEFLQRYGFNTPLLFKEKAGLGLRVPTANFTINDVRMCVGSRRMLDVMDVNTQKNVEMTMKEWQRYYEDPNKERLLNVISLEFSHTRLDNYIQSPTIVRQVDWVDSVWPRHLKEQQVESTNLIEDMMYPKVQKYCLMSVKGCYTDFHVDFGGTSVWYHILKGAKVFWLIPPTERNLQLYEKWVLSGKQSDVFFGDTVEKCIRVHLYAGNTFFIPTGWIHAVYTPSDSLVFGGNFLHQFGIEKQLKIAQVEDATKVPQKFRYPFFTEMLWYVLERYVSVLLGRGHLLTVGQEEDQQQQQTPGENKPPSVNQDPDSKPSNVDSTPVKSECGNDGVVKTERVNGETKSEEKPPAKHIHLTQQELHGLKAIVMYLHQLPATRKSVPELLGDPIALIKDVRTLVEKHRHDSRELAVTGTPVLQSPEEVFNERKRSSMGKGSGSRGPRGSYKKHGSPGVAVERPEKNGPPRRRRTRCKKCEACQRTDCGECVFCQDMVKFGGPGRAKQTCNMRQCLQPMLPVTASCAVCHLDGWMQAPVAPQAKGNSGRVGPSSLMECAVCYSIAHPACVGPGGSPPSEDLPNSWECPQCTNLGLNHDYKPRHFRARQKSSDLRRMSISSDASSVNPQRGLDTPMKEPKLESSDEIVTIKTENGEESSPPDAKRRRSGGGGRGDEGGGDTAAGGGGGGGTSSGGGTGGGDGSSGMDPPRKLALRTQLAHQLCSNSTKQLKKPMYPVRPAQLPGTSGGGSSGSSNNSIPGGTTPLCLDKTCIVSVFRFLTPPELAVCALVCKTWGQYSIDPTLWKNMTFEHCRLTASHLAGIVRRQPITLGLDWSNLSRRQLTWLIGRLPALRNLSLAGSAGAAAVGLRTCLCPPLVSLNLSFCPGLGDACLRDILAPPQDSRPGLAHSKSRLRHLKLLSLAGTDITDVAMRYVTQALSSLTELDLSSCARVTDAGVAQLSSARCLERLSLAGCKLLTEAALDHLAACQNLIRLDLRHVPQVSTQAVIKFAAKSKHNLHVQDVKLVERRKTK